MQLTPGLGIMASLARSGQGSWRGSGYVTLVRDLTGVRLLRVMLIVGFALVLLGGMLNA